MKSKKLFGLAAALLLSTVGIVGLRAQELKFDGYVNSGLGVVSTDSEDTDAFLKAFGVDSSQNGYRFRLNGSYQNEAGNAGAKLRLQSQSKLTTGYISLPYAYGWVKFANNIFYAAGGIVEDATWATADWWLNTDRIDGGLGALLKATPVKGLDLGFGAYVLNLQGGPNNNILGTGTVDFANIRPKIGDVKYTYSAAYTLPDVFRVSATFRWKNKAGYDANAAKDGYQGRDESSRLLSEFRFLGVKNLTALVVGSFDKIEDFDNKGNIIFVETFAYKFNGLSLGLNATQFLYNRKADANPDRDPGLLFNLWGSYAFDNVVPRLDLAYFLGGQGNVGGSGDYKWHRIGFTNKEGVKDVDDDYTVFNIRPSVKFNVNSRVFVEVGDAIYFDSANFDGAYKDSGDAGKKSLLSNVLYIDFKWSF
jgi:hypothetical protein